jgi:uncharacterized damage-inducible protein DinB
MLSRRPAPSEFAPFYANYIAQVPDGDLVATLERQTGATSAYITKLPDAKRTYRYAEGKWSIAETILHVVDSERVFGYRLMRIARGDTTDLPGFDQDAYVPASRADTRTLLSLAAEFTAVRSSTMQLVRNLSDEVWDLMGRANGHGVSARALAWIIAGHEAHHLRILTERYG